MLTFALTLLMALVPEATPAPEATDPTAPHDGWSEPIKVTGAVDGVAVTHRLLMYLPKGYSAAPADRRWPLMLALHGWNHSADMFRSEGDLPRWADQHGVVIAVPDMGKTVYETALYPETKPAKAWSKVSGARWVGEVILPYARAHYRVHRDRAHTGVFGYSTGGRGAFLLAELYPEFAFAGSTSGTFDLMRLQPKEGEYKIHAVVYGQRDAFKERWEKDNIVLPSLIDKLAGVRLYASHGAADKSVNPDQMDALRAALAGRDLVIEYHVEPKAVHDWAFWNSQWEPMFAAFAAVVGKQP